MTVGPNFVCIVLFLNYELWMPFANAVCILPLQDRARFFASCVVVIVANGRVGQRDSNRTIIIVVRSQQESRVRFLGHHGIVSSFPCYWFFLLFICEGDVCGGVGTRRHGYGCWSSRTRGYHRLPHQVCIPSSLRSEWAAEGMARVWLVATVAVPFSRGSQIRVPLVFGNQQR